MEWWVDIYHQSPYKLLWCCSVYKDMTFMVNFPFVNGRKETHELWISFRDLLIYVSFLFFRTKIFWLTDRRIRYQNIYGILFKCPILKKMTLLILIVWRFVILWTSRPQLWIYLGRREEFGRGVLMSITSRPETESIFFAYL
jgi:hypothetical protein